MPPRDSFYYYYTNNGFVPNQIANNAVWLRADLGITTVSGNVSLWKDQSGNHNDVSQSDTSKQPAYFASGGSNNAAYVSWALATHQILTTAGSLGISAPFEYFVVERSLGGIGDYSYAVDFGSNSNTLLQPPSGTVLQLYPGPSTASLSANTDYVVDCVSNGGSSSIAINGGTPATGGSALVAAPAAMQLGNQGAGGSAQAWNGFVYEVIVYARILNSSERALVNSYLQARYKNY